MFIMGNKKKTSKLSKSSRKGTCSKNSCELGKRGMKPPKNWSTGGGWKVPQQYGDDFHLLANEIFKPLWRVHLVRFFFQPKTSI